MKGKSLVIVFLFSFPFSRFHGSLAIIDTGTRQIWLYYLALNDTLDVTTGWTQNDTLFPAVSE